MFYQLALGVMVATFAYMYYKHKKTNKLKASISFIDEFNKEDDVIDLTTKLKTCKEKTYCINNLLTSKNVYNTITKNICDVDPYIKNYLKLDIFYLCVFYSDPLERFKEIRICDDENVYITIISTTSDSERMAYIKIIPMHNLE
jgi:hypothetical protein